MYSTAYVGIDPGTGGAIAIMDPDGRKIQFRDTPTITVRSGKTFKHQLDPVACSKVLTDIKTQAEMLMVSIEKVHAMPGKGADGARQSMGASSAFSFGYGFGVWIGLLAALKIPYQLVPPQTWKAKMMYGMGKEKDASRQKAMQLFPEAARDLYLKKHHNRADALLIAAFGRMAFSGAASVPEHELSSL